MSIDNMTGGGSGNIEKTYCQWNGCQGNPHPVNSVPPYDDKTKGVIKKYPIPNDIHPNLLYGNMFGEKVLGHTIPYRTTKMKSKWYYNYRFQRHHVIPGNMVKKCPQLFNNLELLGWNLNCPISNCMNLPMYDPDIVWHDLQPHRGNHNMYDDRVEDDLIKLQRKCLAFCINSEQKDSSLKVQKDLLDEINKRIVTYKEKIANWQKGFILVTAALYKMKPRESRAQIFTKRSDSKSIPIYPWRSFDSI